MSGPARLRSWATGLEDQLPIGQLSGAGTSFYYPPSLEFLTLVGPALFDTGF